MPENTTAEFVASLIVALKDAKTFIDRRAGYETDLSKRIEILLRDHDVRTYDEAREFHAHAEAKAARYAIAAMLHAQPDKRITFTPIDLHDIGPKDEISSFKDMATGNITYFLIQK